MAAAHPPIGGLGTARGIPACKRGVSLLQRGGQGAQTQRAGGGGAGTQGRRRGSSSGWRGCCPPSGTFACRDSITDRFHIMGGECNYLLRVAPPPPALETANEHTLLIHTSAFVYPEPLLCRCCSPAISSRLVSIDFATFEDCWSLLREACGK